MMGFDCEVPDLWLEGQTLWIFQTDSYTALASQKSIDHHILSVLVRQCHRS